MAAFTAEPAAKPQQVAAMANEPATTGPPATEAGGTLTVDLGAIEANWRALSRRSLPSECAAVIKADGYGCGIEQVAATLTRAGCKTFFVLGQ